MKNTIFSLAVFLAAGLLFAGCGGSDEEKTPGGDNDGAEPEGGESEAAPGLSAKLETILQDVGVDSAREVNYVRSEEGKNGYTKYFFSTDDCRCENGGEFQLAIQPGTVNNVMFFLEGGGAKWPGGGLAVALNVGDSSEVSFRSHKPENPLKDWSVVYVPYCDFSIYTGDNQIDFDKKTHYFYGRRNLWAAVKTLKKFFPNPEKVLLAGVSAGAFGTYMAWPMVKYHYQDTPTYILNDSGAGFWNTGDPQTWETIQQAWNLKMPKDCPKCRDMVFTYLYETYMNYEPHLRIGMFSSYEDNLISQMFLKMDSAKFKEMLISVTDEIHGDFPSRFNRFLVRGDSHSSYEMLFPDGPTHQINGTSMFQWIGQLVNDDPAWADLKE